MYARSIKSESVAYRYMQARHYLLNDHGDNVLTLGGYYTRSLSATPERSSEADEITGGRETI